MKKYLFQLLWMLSISVSAFAQVDNQSEAKDFSNLSLNDAIVVGDSAFVTILTDDFEWPAQVGLRFNSMKDGKVRHSKVISFKRGAVDGQLESLFMWQEKLHLLYSVYYPGPKRNHLLYEQYDLPSFKKLDSKLIHQAYTPGLYRVPFGYSLSPDSTKVLFYSWSYALPQASAKLALAVYDDQLELQWEQKYILPYKNETLFLYDCKVTNAGDAFILGEDYQGKLGRNNRIRPEKIKRFALYVKQKESDFLEYTLEVKGHTVADVKFAMDGENNLFAAGLYNRARKSKHEGIFLYSISSENKKSRVRRFPIDKDRYKDAYSYAEKESAFSSS